METKYRKSTFIHWNCLLLFLFLTSCKESIFIPDPIDPQLPEYTENGNDVAGAIVNGQVWLSFESWGFMGNVYDEPMINLDSLNDSISISFFGQSLGFEFHLAGLHIDKLSDFSQLNNIKIALDGINNFATIFNSNNDSTIANRGTGQFFFKYIHINNSSSMIFSGTFGFVAQGENNKNMEVTYGRYDYNLGVTFLTNQSDNSYSSNK